MSEEAEPYSATSAASDFAALNEIFKQVPWTPLTTVFHYHGRAINERPHGLKMVEGRYAELQTFFETALLLIENGEYEVELTVRKR